MKFNYSLFIALCVAFLFFLWVDIYAYPSYVTKETTISYCVDVEFTILLLVCIVGGVCEWIRQKREIHDRF